jgi:NAD(P)-dependent dehydrogenase (short-subunit alcohol dehydrogenase family)
LQGKIVLVTGGDPGTVCAVGVHFSAEGATVAFTHVPGIEEKTRSNFSKSTRLLLLMISSRLLQILDSTTTAER